MAERIMKQGETFMTAQLQAALAADSRATSMAGMFITLALATIAGGVAWGTGPKGISYLLGGFSCGALLLLGAARAAWAARPIDFYYPGNQPSQWFPNRSANLAEMMGGEAENYDERIEFNSDRLSENQQAIRDAFLLAITAPIIGAVVWGLAICFLTPA
jgi:hypothetical protein